MALEATLEQNTDTTSEVPADDLSGLGQEDVGTPVADDVSSGGSEGAGAEPATSTISADMQSLARDYGLDPDAFGSDGNIRAAVTLLDRQAAEWAKASPQWGQQKPREVPASAPQVTPPQQQSQQFDFDKLFPKDVIAEELTGGLKALYEHFNGQLSSRAKGDEFGQLKEQLGLLQQYHQQQEAQKFESEMDSCFKDLGDEWASIFGKTPMRELPSGSPLKEARQRCVDQLDALKHADVLRGRPMRPDKFYFQAALRSAFSQQTDTAARRQVLQDLGKRKGTALARGNSKAIEKLSPEDRARRVLRQKMIEHKMPVDYQDE